MIIRKAILSDVSALLDIYNYEVIHGVATLDLQPKSLEDWTEWFYAHNIENHPLYVAVIDNNIAGYASFSAYRAKEAYRSTVELSVYIAADYRGKGIATELLKKLLSEAHQDNSIHNIVSVITSGNEASKTLHNKFGFTYCGTIPEVGMKFGRHLNIDNYSLIV